MLGSRPRHLLTFTLAVLCASSAATGPRLADPLIPPGAVWRYLDDGSDQGTLWQEPEFDDAGWPSGAAELGYGDGDEATVVSWGPLSSQKHITTYFRHTFQLAEIGGVWKPMLRLLRDDGAVVYLNGTEVVRSNLPGGPIAFDTPADATVAGSSEESFEAFAIDRALFQEGPNVLAVEVHQRDATSSDVSFDLELFRRPFTEVGRGPYLQQGTPNSAIVHWRTNIPTSTAIWLGETPETLQLSGMLQASTVEHVVPLHGLRPETTYYYAVGDRFDILAGGDAEHRFTTPREVGVPGPVRIWAIGDSGTRNSGAAAVRDGFLGLQDYRSPDVWLMLGDNAYEDGEDDEYQEAVFDMYPGILKSAFLWPTLGNHDQHSADSDTESGVYYWIFDLPRNGEAGGVPSGTEAYYSFDYGDVHFICLDSDDTDRSPAGAMLTWLAADLATTTATWVIAYWHHSPYSRGSHNSDGSGNGGDMRRHAVPLLEAAGVDLVLSGHSHAYERSYLIDGHYGDSDTLTGEMQLDRGDGRVAGDGSYAKPTAGRGAHEGAVYVVAGSSGRVDGGRLDHPAMAVSLETLGSVVIDVGPGRLDARFIDDRGEVQDSFTLHKGLRRSLIRDEPAVALDTGGTQRLSLDAGAAFAGASYLLVGAFGTDPGLDIGLVHVPLNADPWLELSLGLVNTSLYENTLGVLDAGGRAQAAIHVPVVGNPALIGFELHHAFVVYQGLEALMASNSVKIRLYRD